MIRTRPRTVTVTVRLLYAVAALFAVFVAGVGYDLAVYGHVARTVGEHLGISPATVVGDTTSTSREDVVAIGVFGVFGALVALSARWCSRARRAGQIIAYVLTLLIAFSVGSAIIGNMIDSGAPMSALDQAINNAEPAMATIVPTFALPATAPFALAALIMLSLRSVRRWFGPPLGEVIHRSSAVRTGIAGADR